ncbi:Hypothetical predicted protein [Cloeon dipterum]|uniref:FYVE-type domain-containing protein n=1 Tax=Cloeon dipterum TaxID=197152 RepID=A0A8S1CUG7_9INSE|nr:Hypothetical predicted protein [Cloeon dipterum]
MILCIVSPLAQCYCAHQNQLNKSMDFYLTAKAYVLLFSIMLQSAYFHHCRRCGRIYCKNCCDFRLELPRMCFVDPVRHCESCADISRKENEFFDKELKMLTGGALFQLIKLPESNEKRSEFICRLSQDHRYLNFDGSVEEEFEPVQLASIMELNLLRSPDVPPGMFVTYMNNEGTVKEMTLLAPPDCNKNHTISWLSAMQNGFKMATDSRNIS